MDASDRRGFFRQTLGKALQHVAEHTERRVVSRRYVRPPGALPEVGFLAACTRCGACGEICPVRAIRNAPPAAGLAAGTPFLEPSVQACVVCVDIPCARACPTGALVVPADGWASIRMGRVSLDPERCVTFHGAACGVCARACPVGDAALAMDERGHPVLKAEGCVGCGVCVTACITTPSSLRLEVIGV